VQDGMTTVSNLIARFQRRSRAPTDAFHAGVRLAQAGCVQLATVADEQVRAEVRDPSPLTVELHVEGGSLVGSCPCPDSDSDVCRHQVAVAHAVWADMRGWCPRDPEALVDEGS
jgi:uncharacterized Zn finger protein